MTNKRLQEIKDSIDLQMRIAKDFYNNGDLLLILQEEIDLYEEVMRLQERINKAIDFIHEEQELTDIDEVINTDKLLEILGDETNETT